VSPRWSRLRKLAWIVGASLLALLAVGYVMHGGGPAQPSAYCDPPRWAPEIYCAPGYKGPFAHTIYYKRGRWFRR
jgi:hypothetical protein